MTNTTGTCKYCGQLKAIEIPDDYTPEMIDEEVTKNCDCPGAKAAAKVEENITYAEASLEQLFEDKEKLEEMRDQLKACIRPVATCKIDRVSISKDSYTGLIKRTTKGIKVTIRSTSEESMESGML